MQSNKQNRRFAVTPLIVSTAAAMVLSLVALPDSIYYFWPDWLVLVVIYWSLVEPERVGPFFGLSLGLLMDVLMVKHFGVQSLGFAIIAFLINKSHQQLKVMTTWQQMLIVGLLIATFKLIIGWLYGLVSEFNFTLEFWYSILGSMVAWPFVFIMLNELARFARFR
ncbi:MAG: rod shape-determining protein MreD [Pseudomonadota bacterium]